MLLGFDIGGTKCAVVLGEKDADNHIKLIDKKLLPTDKPVHEMIEALFVNAEQALKDNGIKKDGLQGIGISCGGPLDTRKGLILSPPNLPGWNNIAIVEIAEKRFGIKTHLQK